MQTPLLPLRKGGSQRAHSAANKLPPCEGGVRGVCASAVER